MFPSISITVPNLPDLQRIARDHPAAVSRALNRVAQSSRTEASRIITKTYNMKVSEIKDMLKVTPSNRTTLTAKLTARSARLPLSKFNPKETATGVRVSIRRTRTVHLPGAIIATMPSGHKGVFYPVNPPRIPTKGKYAGRVASRGKRKGLPILRKPLEQLFTISAAEMFGSKKVVDEINALIVAKLPVLIQHEVDAIAKGYVGG